VSTRSKKRSGVAIRANAVIGWVCPLGGFKVPRACPSLPHTEGCDGEQ
jgi:hypothetical protein